MSLFPIVAPLIVVATVLGLIWVLGSILLLVREATGGSALVPVFVALAGAAIITVGAFVLSARNDRRRQG